VKTKFFCILFGFVVILSITLETAVAQNREMERALERINTVRLLKMIDALGLERETSAKLASVTNKYCETRKSLLRNMRKDLDALRQILKKGRPDESELKELVGQVKSLKKELADLKLHQMDEEMNLLTREQQARYLIFKVDFHKEMHGLIQEIRGAKKKRSGE
jgi:Spy/CpxP family protein refolding chaperone